RVFGWDDGGTVRAWTVSDGKPADPDQPPPRPADRVATSPDGAWRAEARGDFVALSELGRDDPERALAERRAPGAANPPARHQQQAALAEQDGDWFAAAFPLGHLLADRPDDADLKARRQKALDQLGRAPPARMDKVPPP